jgi:hypothetical protein
MEYIGALISEKSRNWGRSGGMAQVIEHLLIQSSNPSTAKVNNNQVSYLLFMINRFHLGNECIMIVYVIKS